MFVTGTSNRSTSGADYATVAYDASTGARLWVRRFNGPASRDDAASAVGVGPGGARVFVTGSSKWSTNPRFGHDYATVAYDAGSGARLWVQRYKNGPGNYDDIAGALGVSPDGSKVFVTGQSDGLTNSKITTDYATVAYRASSGAQLWVRRYNGPGNSDDLARALGVSPGGARVFVTGSYATVAYNASSGAPVWVRRYYGSARALGVSPNGSKVFVTGNSAGAASNDYATAAYNASSGAPLWVRRYNGTGNFDDFAFALGVSPDGSQVFVTGYSWGSTSSFDYATLAHNASTGARLWVRRHDGPANGEDFATALGVSTDGSKLFVTGGSPGSTTSGQDFGTLAYSIP